MAINHIICCDGTNNEFGKENTNVVRVVQSIVRDPARQRLYYDPGVGTLPEPGAFFKIQQAFSELRGLAFGAGLAWKVQEAYTYLMDFWQPGDKVFLFGFSRGAYTVRVLAGLLHALGLLPRGNYNLLPYVIRLFGSLSQDSHTDESQGTSKYWKICDEFRKTFSREYTQNDHDRRFRVDYLGVWDTVASVGWVWDPAKYPYTSQNPSIQTIRHAVSIDERRWFYRQNLMKPCTNQDFQEQWFPGVHCDVGGGYPESEGGLWQEAFLWVLTEAQKSGLVVDNGQLGTILSKHPLTGPAWREPQHESLKGIWWLAEFFPKWSWNSTLGKRVLSIGLGKHRTIPKKAVLNEATLKRINVSTYSPINLSNPFLEKIRQLSSINSTLEYEPEA